MEAMQLDDVESTVDNSFDVSNFYLFRDFFLQYYKQIHRKIFGFIFYR